MPIKKTNKFYKLDCVQKDLGLNYTLFIANFITISSFIFAY